MKNISIALSLLSLATSALALPQCATNNGIVTDTRECRFNPETYKFVVYEVGVCTGAPGAPTANTPYDTSGCSRMYSKTSGQTITLTNTQTSFAVTGDVQRPSNGLYNYQYLLLAPRVSINTSVTFDSNRTARKQMGTDGTGTTCWTTESSKYSFSDDNGEPGRVSFNYVACGSSATARGDMVSIFNSFDNGGVFDTSATLDSGGTMYLVSDSGRLATTPPTGVGDMGDVSKLLYYGPTSSVAITNDTQGMNLRVNKSLAARIKGSGANDAHTSSDPIVYFGVMDFQLELVTH